VKNVLIGGIGNVLLGDDGVGPYVVRLLSAQYVFEEGVEIVDLGTPALDLIDQISGRDAVILIDSVNVDEDPGTVLSYRKEEISRLTPQVRMDPHSPALVETLLAAELFGTSPADLLLIGICGQSYEPNCSLSGCVNESLGRVLSEVLGELDRLGVEYKKKPVAEDLDIWWSADPGAQVQSLR